MSAALTGGVAEGKTTVLRMLSEFGLSTLAADEVAKEVMEDPGVHEVIREELGFDLSQGRGELRAAVAADPSVRRALNEIVHAEVFARIVESGPDVVEIPLLIETCIQSAFSRIWVATCGHAEQLRRLTERLGDATQAQALIATQLPAQVKIAFADRVVRTDRPLADVQREAEELARSLVSR